MKPLPAKIASRSMVSTIHVLKSRAGMDDDTYRDFLARETGCRSARDLDAAQAGRVIDRLRALAGEGPAARGAVAGLDSAIGGKLRALWIAGYNLGVVRERGDRAMLSFLERQTGVSHVRFLQHPGAGTAAIEGLKSWLGRTAKIEWPTDTKDAVAARRAVLDAQWLRLIELRAVKPFLDHEPLADLDAYAFKVAGLQGWGYFEASHYDEVQAALGRKLRAVLAANAARNASTN